MATISGARDAYLTEVVLVLRDLLSGESNKAGASLDRLGRSTGSLDRSFGSASTASDRFGMSLKSLGLQALALNEIRGLTLALLAPLQRVGELSDVWKEMSARVGIFKDPAEKTADIMAQIGRVAQESRTPVAEVGKLYARLAQGLSEQHVSQKELLGIVQGMSDALLISGASAAEAGGAIMQFSQAMASGTLRGEEFNSVAEQAPIILDALASYLKVAKGTLRAMAAEGQITSDVMRKAIGAMSAQWRKSADEMPLTIGRAMTNLTSAFTQYLGTNRDVIQGTSLFSAAINGLAKNLGTIGPAIEDAGTILFYAAMLRGVAVLAQFSQAKMADAKASQVLAAEQRLASAQAVQSAAAAEVATKANFEEAMSVWGVADAQNAKSRALAGALLLARADNAAAIAAAQANHAQAVSAREAAVAQVALVESKRRYYAAIGTGVYEQKLAAAQDRLTQAIIATEQAQLALNITQARSINIEVELSLETARFAQTREALAAANIAVAESELAVQAAVAKDTAARLAQAAAATTAGLSLRNLFSVSTLLNGAIYTFLSYELGAYLRRTAEGAGVYATIFKGLEHDLRLYNKEYDAQLRVEEHAAEIRVREIAQLKQIREQTGLSLTDMKEANAARASGLLLWDSQNKRWEKGVAILDELAQGMGTADTAYQRVLKAMEKDIAARNTTAKAQEQLTTAHIESAKAAGDELGALDALAAAKRTALTTAQEDLAQRQRLLSVARAELIVAEEQAQRLNLSNDVSKTHIANLKNQVTEYEAAVTASQALSVAALTEAQSADAASKSFGDQSAQLVQLQGNQEYLAARLGDIKGAMQLAAVAAANLGQAEQDAHKAHSDYIIAVGTGATKDIPALKAAMDAADATVNGLNQRMDAGVAANARLIPTQQALAMATRLVADAAKDAAAGVDIQIKTLQADTQLALGRLGLARDQLEQDRESSKFRREDAVAMLEIANDQQGRQDAINAIRAEDIIQRQISADAFQNEQDALEGAMHAKEQEAEALREKARLLEIAGKATGDYSREEQAQVNDTLRAADALTLESQRMEVARVTKEKAFAETERLRKKSHELSLAFEESGISGVRSIRDVASAIQQADSTGNLDKLAKALTKAWREGGLAAEEYRTLLEDIQKRQNDLATAADKSWKDRKSTIQYEDLFKKYGTDISQAFGKSADPVYTSYEIQVKKGYAEWLAQQQPDYKKPASEMTAAETFAKRAAPAPSSSSPTETKIVRFEFPLTKQTVTTKMSDGGATSLLDAIDKEMATALHRG
jgi:tape measure domain-containing protein